MSYISFDKQQLINLGYSLNKELLRSNRSGGFSSTTIINCNTRKYHGLLIVPQPDIDADNHVLLSAIDETIIQHDSAFNLGVHMYPGGILNPKGHKYIRDFESDPLPKLTYRVGGVKLTRETMFASNESRLLMRYTLIDAHSPTTLRLKPFLAFRNVHGLSKANDDANTSFREAPNGASWQLYPGYSRLFMQLSKKARYAHQADWYYNIEYIEEKKRGFECTEDLLVPGTFECPIKKGESIVVSIGLHQQDPKLLKRQFNAESKKRTPRNSFENCLNNAAEQFIVQDKNKTELIAGFPYFGRWSRDTFIALPGLFLTRGAVQSFESVLETSLKKLKSGVFPDYGLSNEASYRTLDASLWMFWTLQKYKEMTGSTSIWDLYGKKLKQVLTAISDNQIEGIGLHENKLVYAEAGSNPVSWMDVVYEGRQVTPRKGYLVELNALWYNAVCFSLELAEEAEDASFLKKWKGFPEKIKTSFTEVFWNKARGYLSDFVHEETDWSVRPNMLFAVSMPYSILSLEMQGLVLSKIKSELLTPRGIRTLSPKNLEYLGHTDDSEKQHLLSYHQGSNFPWLLGHYAEAVLKVYENSGIEEIERIYSGFEKEMNQEGIGTISEVYDGDPPFRGRGAISQAWNVAELLRIRWMLDQIAKKRKGGGQ